MNIVVSLSSKQKTQDSTLVDDQIIKFLSIKKWLKENSIKHKFDLSTRKIDGVYVKQMYLDMEESDIFLFCLKFGVNYESIKT